MFKRASDSIPNVLVSLTAPGEAALSASQRPEFFRLPKPRCGGDPYFHFTRSYYYEGEKNGWWKLVRLRKRGRQRGVTLIPFAEVERFVKSQMEENGK
jgi:hypothetical protein